MTTNGYAPQSMSAASPSGIGQSGKRRQSHDGENREEHIIARGDEVMDINSHVIRVKSHMTRRHDIISLGEESDEEGSTAGEGETTIPSESTNTDFLPEPMEPVDYIEANPRIRSKGAMVSEGYDVPPPPPSHRYENWSILMNAGKEGWEEGGKRGEMIGKFWINNLVSAFIDIYSITCCHLFVI